MPRKNRRYVVYAGFAEGFLSPFLFFGRRPFKLSYRNYDTTTKAWREVGEELAEATRIEGKKLGKSTDLKPRKLATP